jgi:hypothetical protein
MGMFSDHYQAAREQIAGLRRQRAATPAALRPLVSSDFVPLLWEEEFGTAGALDRAILGRSATLKLALYGGRVFAIVPIYVTSICSEQCLYCNYRAGNKGIGPVWWGRNYFHVFPLYWQWNDKRLILPFIYEQDAKDTYDFRFLWRLVHYHRDAEPLRFGDVAEGNPRVRAARLELPDHLRDATLEEVDPVVKLQALHGEQ